MNRTDEDKARAREVQDVLDILIELVLFYTPDELQILANHPESCRRDFLDGHTGRLDK